MSNEPINTLQWPMPQRAASVRQRMAACALVEMAASVKEKRGTPTMIEMFASFASLVQVANWLATIRWEWKFC